MKVPVNPLLSPSEGLFISSPFEGRGAGIWEGGFFNLEMTMAGGNLLLTMVSVVDKELEYKVEKLKYKKF